MLRDVMDGPRGSALRTSFSALLLVAQLFGCGATATGDASRDHGERGGSGAESGAPIPRAGSGTESPTAGPTVRPRVSVRNPYVTESAGGFEGLMLDDNGVVHAWALPTEAVRRGSPAAIARLTPIAGLPPSQLAVAMISGGCAVSIDGELWCWYGPARDAESPEHVASVAGVTALAEGCVVHDGGQVSCWDPRDRWDPSRVAGVEDAVALTAGAQHWCAVLRGGEVRCWGDNDRGQWGIEPFPRATRGAAGPPPANTPGIGDAVAVAGSSVSTCALGRGGRVACWGQSYRGNLGVDPGAVSLRTYQEVVRWTPPVAVPVSGDIEAIASAARVGNTCVLRSAGTVACWGEHIDPEGASVVSLPFSRPVVDVALESRGGLGLVCGVDARGGVECIGVPLPTASSAR